MAKYYTLVGINRETKQAEIIFGDHDKSVVNSELQEYNDKKRLFGKDSEYVKFGILTSTTYLNVEIEPLAKEFERLYNEGNTK